MKDIEFRRRRTSVAIVAGCLAITLAFVVLDWTINYRQATDLDGILGLFNMAREDSLSGWFAVTVTTLAAVTAWLVWAIVRKGAGRRGNALGWLVVALFLTWMSADDGASVHERVGSAFGAVQQRATNFGDLGSLMPAFPSYPWQAVLLPLYAMLGAFTLLFLWWARPDWWGRTLTSAAFGCLAIAVGIDFLEGLDQGHPANLQMWLARQSLFAGLTAPGYPTPFESVVHFGKVAEEAIEITGLALLLAVLVDQLAAVASELRIKLL